MKILLIATLCLASLGTAPAIAQSSASYEDTVAFIRGKVEVRNNIEKQSISFPERCNMRIVNQWHDYDERGLKFRTVTDVPLAELDPSAPYSMAVREKRRLIQQDHGFAVASHTALKQIKLDYNNDPPFSCNSDGTFCSYPRGMSDYAWFNLMLPPDDDNKPRVLRAVKHLIGLCGGREQLF